MCKTRTRAGQSVTNRKASRLLVVPALAVLLAGCASAKYPYQTEMMPPPAIYDTDAVAPPETDHRELADGTVRIPYATTRLPAGEDDKEPFFLNDRGNVMRLGFGVVRVGEPGSTREELIAASSAPGSAEPLLLAVPEIEALGVLPQTRPPFAPVDFDPTMARDGPGRMASRIDAALLDGPGHDIHVYVHGYKVVFENPLAVSTELWHYLDYEGVVVAFSWPATPKRLAYLGDLETGEAAAIGLRQFLQYLCSRTQARRINLIGYSAGARVVTAALAGLALEAGTDANCGAPGAPKVGDVVLIGSDMDREVLGLYLEDRILDAVERFTVYTSSSDSALRVSKFLFGRPRAGETLLPEAVDQNVMAWLNANLKLAFVDVTDAAQSTTENGHRYFRKSPWVSSDMLMMLRFGMDPDQRGLVRDEGQPSWRFPPDYVERLATGVRQAGQSRAGH